MGHKYWYTYLLIGASPAGEDKKEREVAFSTEGLEWD